MGATITAEEIRETRGKYGLSQRAFASVLGIGAASIARYERGVQPTRANANLIRAAANPEFMMDCARREGSSLSQEQRDGIASVYYALIELPADSTPVANRMNEVYDLTLKQEVLNEQAANLACDLMNYLIAANIDARDKTNLAAATLDKVLELKRLLLSPKADDFEVLEDIQGYFKFTSELVAQLNVCSEVA